MHMKSCTQSVLTLNCLLWYRVHNVWPKLERHESEIKYTQSSRETTMFTSPTVIWSDAIVWQPRLFSRRKKRGEQKDRDSRMPPNPLGASMFSGVPERCSAQALCMTMTSQPFLLFSTTVQDQSLGSSLFFDTIFWIFCLTVMGNVWKPALCISEGSSLTDGPVSSGNCCPRLPQMEAAEEIVWGRPFQEHVLVWIVFFTLLTFVHFFWISVSFLFHLWLSRHFPVCSHT